MINRKSSNPIFGEKLYNNGAISRSSDQTMTVKGTMNKTFMLTLILFTGATISYNNLYSEHINTLLYGGMIGGLIFALITIFKRDWAPITAPIYAFCEGLFLGAVSSFFIASGYSEIVVQAVALTFGVLLSMIFIYRNGLIKVNDRFRGIMMTAILGVLLFYLTNWIVGFWGISLLGMGGAISIVISLVIVAIASLSLLLDLDFIYKGEQYGLDKKMEWYGAFGLMVTLVWLYLELLRLLSYLSRD